MESQQHVIGRQTLKLRFTDAATARESLPRVRAAAERDVAAAIEAVLDEVSTALGGRFDRIAIDLGRIRLGSMSVDLIRAIRSGLPSAIAAARHARPAAASIPVPHDRLGALALIAFFARTGRLPWWQGWRETSLSDVVAEAACEDRSELRGLLGTLAGEAESLTRLVRHVDDSALALAVDAEAADLAARPPEGVPRDVWRRALWRALFLNDAAGLRLRDIAARLEVSMQSEAGPTDEAADHGFEEGLPAARASEGWFAAPIGAAAAVPDTSLASMSAAASSDFPRGAGAPRPSDDGLASVETTRSTDEASTGKAVGRPSNDVPVASDAETGTGTTASSGKGISGRRERSEVPSTDAAAPRAFEPAEERCPVENAGLVLLWPFLPRYFANLHLTDETHRFRHAAARHRAAAALQAVATDEAEIAEWWLPLAKAICGTRLDEPHLPGAPLNRAELNEAATLRAAVAAHLGPAGEIAPDALAPKFLLRPGTLATRDGAWLLRVERRPIDAVLDRLSWTLAWLRLPWMEAPMRIEW